MKEKEGVLFSAEEMNKIEKGNLWSQQQGPVTVLGHTFENDEERRAYFREELRKRLPELRKIEGFPIGEDDDIINLSDPPYYTACPNPWLNDFIAEWEKEKEQLEREGKRKKDFEVKEPYAYGIQQGKNSSIYNAHTYHTKVPHQVIMRYILHYTQPGDIVLDGFAGTGMTGVASSLCGHPTIDDKNEIEADFLENGYKKPKWGFRPSICGDLSPICFHISSNYNSKVNPQELSKVVDEIVKKLEKRFGYFYEIPVVYKNKETKGHINYFVWSEIVGCNNCGQEMNVHDLSFDYNTKTLHKDLKCPYCGTIQKRTEALTQNVTTYDDSIGKTIDEIKYGCCLINYSIPKHGRFFSRNIPAVQFPEYEGFVPTYMFGDGDKFGDPKRVGVNYVSQLYFKRTKYILAYLYDLIHCKYKEYKKPLMFIFTSMLPKLTRMNRYMPQHGSRALVGPMANTLYIPPQCVENNPIDQFIYQAGKIIRSFSECKSGAAIQICSATKSSVANNSVDYIFTDPPFGANIMYSELNTVSESWLKVMTNNHEEAISNNTQRKGLMEYQAIMTECFKEYSRILKPGHWMTVEFSNTSAAFWNALQYSIKSAGFIISTITDLNKERGGLHAMIGPTAVKQDLAISCYKPSKKITEKIMSNPESNIWDLVSEHLLHVATFMKKNGQALYILERDPRIIYDRIISYYVQHGYQIPMDAHVFQRELKEHFIERDGMYFTALQADEYEEKRKKSYDYIPMGLIVTDEASGIEWLKLQLKKPQTYQDIYNEWLQAVNGLRKGDQLPELRDILEENFLEDETNHWYVPDLEKQIDLDKLKHKRLMKVFNFYKEMAQKPRARIKEVRTEALREGFKQCFKDKDFATILLVGDKIPQNILTEDEVLLQYYDIAQMRS